MLSEDAQNRIISDGQDLLSYSQDVELHLTQYMKEWKKRCVDALILKQDETRRKKAMKVLDTMLSADAQNRIVYDGQDLLATVRM